MKQLKYASATNKILCVLWMTIIVIFSGLVQSEIFASDGEPNEPAAIHQLTLSESLEAGERIFNHYCMPCHQSNGEGIRDVFPPLAKSDYLMEDVDRAIGIIINGLSGPITVNGKEYNSVMIPRPINDEEIANVMNFVLNSWGNSYPKQLTPADVGKIRASRPKAQNK